MKDLGYNQLMRALKHFGFEPNKRIKIDKMEELLYELRIRNKPVLTETELNFFNYRFGIYTGMIRTVEHTAKKFGMEAAEVKAYEEIIIKKIINYLKLRGY